MNETTRMKSHRMFLPALVLLITGLLWSGSVLCGIPEPDHIFYGTAPQTAGTLSVHVGQDPTPVASFVVGSRPELGDHYILRIPMDSVDPRGAGTARNGDAAVFYLNGVEATTAIVGRAGEAQFLDLSSASDREGLRIADLTLLEGDEDSRDAVFEVRLNPAHDDPVSVSYTIEEGSASRDVDLLPPDGQNGANWSGLLEFAPGTTSRTIVVPVAGDLTEEPDETFFVVLHDAVGAPIDRDRATCTILDDDAPGPPAISIADLTIGERASQIVAEVTVSLSRWSENEITVAYATVEDTAIAGNDFGHRSGLLVFPPGTTRQVIEVTIFDDADEEDVERFFVALSDPVHAQIARGQAVVTVVDDDGAGSGLIVGRVEVGAVATEVPFGSTMNSPVVLLGPPTDRGEAPVVAALDRVDGDRFEVRIAGWSGAAIGLTPEQVAYLAIEQGRHLMADGSIWEAGTFAASPDGPWLSRSFDEPFPGTPRLFLTIQGPADEPLRVVRTRHVSGDGFDVRLFGRVPDGGVDRTIGYVAIHSDAGSGTVRGAPDWLPYLMQDPMLDDRMRPVLSWALRTESPATSGGDGRKPPHRRSRPRPASVEVSVLALGSHLFAQSVGGETAQTVRLRAPEHAAVFEWGSATGIGEEWKTVPLAVTYTNPVVVARPLLIRGADPVTLPVRNVTARSFEVLCRGWSGQPADDAARVGYLVAESGEHALGGLRVLAGKLETALRIEEGWERVAFGVPFSDTPVVFAGLQASDGEQPVLTRVHRRDPDGFDLALQLREAGAVSSEQTLGWIAIERGEASTADGAAIRVFDEVLDGHPARTGSFGLRAAGDAVSLVLAGTGSTFHAVPSFVCFKQDEADAGEAFLDVDGEPRHSDVVEEVCFFDAKWTAGVESPPATDGAIRGATRRP